MWGSNPAVIVTSIALALVERPALSPLPPPEFLGNAILSAPATASTIEPASVLRAGA